MRHTRIVLLTAAALLAVPVIAAAATPFNDVPDGQYYSDPVAWAYDNGITTGTSENTFSPNDPVTRGEVVTFLHRYHENIVSELELGGDLGALGCADDQVIDQDGDDWVCADLEVIETLGDFEDQTIATAGKPGYYLDAVIGPDGNPLVASMTLGSIKFSMTSCYNPLCTSAESSVVDGSGFVGFDSVMDVPSDGLPVAAYTDQTTPRGLGFFKCADSFCQSGTVSNLDDGDGSFVGYHPVITINGLGNPVIGHRNLTSNTFEILVCLDPACEATVTRLPALASSTTSGTMFTQPNGNPVLIYGHWAGGIEAYACTDPTCAGGTSTLLVSDMRVGSIDAIEGADGRAIVFWNEELKDEEFHIMRCTTDDCSAAVDRTVTTPAGTQPGGYVSIDLDPDGVPVAAMHDFNSRDLWLYRCGDTHCTDGTLDELGVQGVYNQVLIHENGDTIVIYYDRASESLDALVAEVELAVAVD